MLDNYRQIHRPTGVVCNLEDRSSRLSVGIVNEARFKRRSIHAPNLTDELSTAEERRLNQFGSAD